MSLCQLSTHHAPSRLPAGAFRTLVLAAAVLVGLALAAQPASAAARWVSDKLQVTVRTGPSTENKIIAVADSGDQVELLSGDRDGWVKVRIDDKEGWMLSRYLQEEPTAAIKLEKLDPQNKTLLQQVEEQTKASQELSQSLARAESANAKLEAEYAGLKDEAAGFIKLKKEHQALQEDYQRQKERLAALATEVESLRFSSNLKWFMAGAGVLILGWLIGLAMGRKKRRQPHSLY